MSNLPLVTCIMPTYNRPKYMMRAIKLFIKQKYPNKELIIVDDSPTDVPNLSIPKMSNVTYIRLSSRRSIGYKRNLALTHARGNIFMFWDDDDYYSCNRIHIQVKPIIDNLCDITVFSSITYYNAKTDSCYKTSDKDHNLIWYNGYASGSLTCKYSLFNTIKFKHTNIAEDRDFIIEATKRGARILTVPNKMDYIYTRHASNSFDIPKVHKITVKHHQKLKLL